MDEKYFYVSTPIYYVNDRPHIGHAYTTIAGDVIARFYRQLGYRVMYLTGTDEHGQKIEKAAMQRGISPKALADSMVPKYKQLWEKLNISYDNFIRTTDPEHEKMVQEFWMILKNKGDIYLGEYEGWYCTGCEAYYTKTQLPDDKHCPIHKRPLEKIKEKSYFFSMSKYQQALIEHIEKNPDFVMPETRRNEVLSFLKKERLQDLSISRTSFSWGVKVPDDSEHIVYVWFDALLNYISGIGGLDQDGRVKSPFWPCDCHLIGKDILRFHAVYWPIMLMAAGIPLPKTIFGHGWWTVEGQKMSKSLRNVVDPNLLIELYGRDAVRYFVLREVPFGLDGDFSHDALIGRYNAELANDIGNLLSRFCSMATKYLNATLMPIYEEVEKDIETAIKETVESFQNHMKRYAFSMALGEVINLAGKLNKFIDQTEPWRLNKEGRIEDIKRVLTSIWYGIRALSYLLWSFMPEKSIRMLKQLGLNITDNPQFKDLKTSFDKEVKILAPESIFPRIDEKKRTKIESLVKSKMDSPQTESEKDDLIDINEFAKVRLVAGRVIRCEDVKKSKRLLLLEVDIGENRPRQIVSGIKEFYRPDELVGKMIILVANLKPAKIMGIESRGMLLAAKDSDTGRVEVVFLNDNIKPGSFVS